jgi:hypothetical protein
MDKLSHTPADTLHQADEDILTYTVSDEAIEAAAGIERREGPAVTIILCSTLLPCGRD